MENTNFNHFFLTYQQIEIKADTAYKAVQVINEHLSLNLPPLTKGVLKKAYEGITDDIRNEVERECVQVIQNLIDSDYLMLVLDKMECFKTMLGYTLWAIENKANQYAQIHVIKEEIIVVNPDKKEALWQLLINKRETGHFLNESDLRGIIADEFIPINFVVWTYSIAYGTWCVGYCEFNNKNKYLCFYK